MHAVVAFLLHWWLFDARISGSSGCATRACVNSRIVSVERRFIIKASGPFCRADRLEAFGLDRMNMMELDVKVWVVGGLVSMDWVRT